jgi:hypothetical protein
MPSDPHSRSAGPRAGAKLGQIDALRQIGALAVFGALGPWAEMGIVSAVVVILALVLAPLDYLFTGGTGLMALVVAGGVSLAAAVIALAVGRLFRGTRQAMYASLAGMLIRMSVALAAALVLRYGTAALAGGAMMFYLLVFYLATLSIETTLMVARIRPDVHRPEAGNSNSALPKAV